MLGISHLNSTNPEASWEPSRRRQDVALRVSKLPRGSLEHGVTFLFRLVVEDRSDRPEGPIYIGDIHLRDTDCIPAICRHDKRAFALTRHV